MFCVRWFYRTNEIEEKKTIFIHTNQPSITLFYKKIPSFRRISDESALIRNFLRNARVRGKPIRRVKVSIESICNNVFFNFLDVSNAAHDTSFYLF